MSWGIRFAAKHGFVLEEFDRQVEACMKYPQPGHAELFAGMRKTLEAYLTTVIGDEFNNGFLVSTSGHVAAEYGNVTLEVSSVHIA